MRSGVGEGARVGEEQGGEWGRREGEEMNVRKRAGSYAY